VRGYRTLAGIASLAAMLVGALLGGVLGERWHSKLTRRAVSGNDNPDWDDRPITNERAATAPAFNQANSRLHRSARADRSRGRGTSRID
jgi:hypothetical protein